MQVLAFELRRSLREMIKEEREAEDKSESGILLLP
jgi:hypothetical protein